MAATPIVYLDIRNTIDGWCNCNGTRLSPYNIIDFNDHLLSTRLKRDRRGRNRMVVGFTTTCTISAYHQYRCEFESRYNIM